jgi:hypothetical protein
MNNGAVIGYYSTQERRTKASLEARRTHFILGKHGLQRGPVKPLPTGKENIFV